MKKKALKICIWCAVLTAAAVFAVLGFRKGWFEIFRDSELLRKKVSETGVWAPFVFFLLQFAQVLAAPIPGNVTTLVGGTLFGFTRGFLISASAVVLGSVCAFLLARRYGMPLVKRFVPSDAIEKYSKLLEGRSALMLAIMFLFPFFPDDILCFLAGTTPISFRRFMVLTVLTRPWGLLCSALIGSGMLSLPLWAMVLLALLGAALLVLSARFGPALEAKMTEWAQKIKNVFIRKGD